MTTLTVADRRKTRTAVLSYAAAGAIGIAIAVGGELLVGDGWTDNAAAVGQVGGVIFLLAAVPLLTAARWSSQRRVLLVALGIVSPAALIAYWLPAAPLLGAAGVAVAWLHGALGRDRRPDVSVLERACAVLCVFAAAAWIVVYVAIVVSELTR